MRIALLCHALRGGGGISVGHNIIAALGRLAPGERYLVSIPGGLGYEAICESLPDREIIPLRDHSWSRRWRFDHRLLPKRLDRFRPDIVVGMSSLGYQGKKLYPQAIICLNPYLLYSRRHFGRSISIKELFEIYLKRLVFSRDLRRTGLVFTPTRVTDSRIRSRYNYRGRSIILPNAISEFTRAVSPGTPPPPEFQPFPDHFKLFYIARYYPHKNIEVLVDLFDRYREQLEDTVLFITVAPDQQSAVKRLLDDIRKKHLEKKIINIGSRWLQPELANYYSHVDALLMPSLMEIFSGSYLEAMHYGVPILTSDLDFAHEVCGDAALYFDPWNPSSIQDAIAHLRNGPDTAGSLIRAGKKQSEGRFINWDEVSQTFLTALRELGKKEAD
ncbi:MAG: glycosyltransferase [PVC group bacterium]